MSGFPQGFFPARRYIYTSVNISAAPFFNTTKHHLIDLVLNVKYEYLAAQHRVFSDPKTYTFSNVELGIGYAVYLRRTMKSLLEFKISFPLDNSVDGDIEYPDPGDYQIYVNLKI
jgi:hypothetical protein